MKKARKLQILLLCIIGIALYWSQKQRLKTDALAEKINSVHLVLSDHIYDKNTAKEFELSLDNSLRQVIAGGICEATVIRLEKYRIWKSSKVSLRISIKNQKDIVLNGCPKLELLGQEHESKDRFTNKDTEMEYHFVGIELLLKSILNAQNASGDFINKNNERKQTP